MERRPLRPPLRRGARFAVARGCIVLLCIALVACAPAPRRRPVPAKAPEKKTIILSSEYDDRRAGDEGVAEIVAQLGLVQDAKLVALVQQIGARLVAYAPARPFDYRFAVIDEWSPNAFTLPGGAIFVSRGLLALTTSEDELACVLAHEITHASERHAAAQQQIVRANPFLMGFAGLAWLAAYARDQERVADRGGQTMCAAAGYDPAAMSEFLQALGDLERLQTGVSRLPYFFETHPGVVERAATTAAYAQALKRSAQPPVTRDRADYLGRLVGIFVDANPAGGVFVGSRFLHPDLGFGISFPDGWTLVNTPAAVGAIAADRDARIALESGGAGADPKAAAEEFLSTDPDAANAEIEAEQSLLVGGLPAYEVTGHVPTAAGYVSGQITWIAFQNRVYRISTAAPSVAVKKYLGRLRASARSFRALTPEERELVFAERLAVVRAKDDESLAELVRRTDTSADVERIAVLNHLPSSTRLTKGQLLKIFVKEPYRTTPAPAPPAAPRPTPVPAR